MSSVRPHLSSSLLKTAIVDVLGGPKCHYDSRYCLQTWLSYASALLTEAEAAGCSDPLQRSFACLPYSLS